MHRTDRFVGEGAGLAAGEPRDPEIGDLDRPIRQQHDILRLDVPVDNALVVRVLERPEDLDGKMDCLFPAEHLLLLDIFLEGDPVDILHDDRLHPVGKAHVVDPHDIRMVEHRHCLALVLEPAAHILIIHMLFLQNLDGNHPVFEHIVRLIDVCHAADADDLHDLIPALELFA